MNEGVDIALMGAKLAASENEGASVTVHSLSLVYNLAQIVHYRYEYCNEQRLSLYGGEQMFFSQQEQYGRELAKHTFLAVIDGVSLFLMGLSALQRSR